MEKLRLLSYLIASAIPLEVAAYPKPGNVHRLRDFSDTKFEDFLVTSVVGEYYVFRAVRRGCRMALKKPSKVSVFVGDLIEGMVRDYKIVSGGGNTCLGSSLLLLPIAVASGYVLCFESSTNVDSICSNAKAFLQKYSTVQDSIHFYNAIRLVTPSYIRKEDYTGEFPNVWDVEYSKKLRRGGYTLWKILVHSAEKDVVAREVVEGYPRSRRNMVFLKERIKLHGNWNRAVIETYLYQLSNELDTLVIRKQGLEIAKMVSETASKVLETCQKDEKQCESILIEFDKKLGEMGVNPGSTADIVASTIALYAISKGSSIARG